MNSEFEIKNIEGSKYSFVSYVSNYNNWKYIFIYDLNQLFLEYNSELMRFRVVIILCLLIMFISSVYIAFISSKPIMGVVNKLTNTSDSLPDFNYKFNELDYIGKSVDDILKQRDNDVRINTLLNILWGQYDDQQQMELEIEEASIQFDFTDFCVANIYSHDYNGFDIINIINEKMPPFLLCNYALNSHNRNLSHIIFNFDENSDAFNLVKIILSDWISQLSHKCYIGFGGIEDNIMNLNKSFVQAKSANKYAKQNSEKSSIVFFSEIELKISSVELMNFKKTATSNINKGDQNALLSKLDNVMASIPNVCTNEVYKYIIYGIVNTLNDSVTYLDLPSTEVDKLTREIVSTPVLDRTVINNKIYSLAKILCSYNYVESKDDEELLNRINDIINKKMGDQMLTLETFSDECGVSVSYLGRFFKQYLDTTPMKYINIQKMEYAKKMLRESDIPLNEIVLKTGYIDVSNFIRKFKTETGMTPISYRKKHLN